MRTITPLLMETGGLRVLFYWSMFHEDYWLAEFLPISRLLRQVPAEYAEYLDRKVAESRRIQVSLTLLSRHLNYRQVALLGHAVKNPHARYTVQFHSRSHNVVTQTARTDLQGLASQGFLIKETEGRGHAWTPARDLSELLGYPATSGDTENRILAWPGRL